MGQEEKYNNWALFFCGTFTPVFFFVKVSEHAGTSKYYDKSIGELATCTVQLH